MEDRELLELATVCFSATMAMSLTPTCNTA